MIRYLSLIPAIICFGLSIRYYSITHEPRTGMILLITGIVLSVAAAVFIAWPWIQSMLHPQQEVEEFNYTRLPSKDKEQV